MTNERPMRRPVRAGDIVLNKLSGEKWLVAAVSPDGKQLACAGWPESIADVADCEVIEYADEAAFEKMLAESRDSNGIRGSWTREVFRVRREHAERQAAKVLTFDTLRKANIARMEQLAFGRTLEEWPVERWGLALGGAVGDVLKAENRIPHGHGSVSALADALADVAIYADLLAARAGFGPSRPHPHKGPELHDFLALANASANSTQPTTAPIAPSVVACLDLMYAAMEAASDPECVANEPFVLMALQRIADAYGIDLAYAVVRKFNATSDRVKSPVRITENGVVSQ